MTPSTVTAISDTSITIKTSSGESKTYAISSSTAIVKDEGTATAADIAVGNTALVISDDGTNASRIIVNPPEDGGPRTFNNGTETPGVQTN